MKPIQDELYRQIMDEREQILSPCDRSRYRVFQRLISNPEIHLAVSFGAGSVPALAANAAFAALLEELEVRPYIKEIWGTSAGSIVGGAWCTGTPAHEILELLLQLNRKGVIDVPKWEVYVKGLIRALLFRTVPEGLIRGKYFFETIQKGLTVQSFEECSIPFRAVACTDDGYARKVIFRSGLLANALFASMCLPGILFPFPDWNSQSYGYFDGGMVEKTPLLSVIDDHLRQGLAKQLLILCTYYSDDARIEAPKGFIQRYISTIDRMQDIVWEHQLSKARSYPNSKFLILNPHLPLGGMLEFEHVLFHYLWSRKRFKEQLSNAEIGQRFNAR